jgi:hypothetical protein
MLFITIMPAKAAARLSGVMDGTLDGDGNQAEYGGVECRNPAQPSGRRELQINI